MAVSELETETKYEAAADVALPALEGLPGVAATRADQEDLTAEYYDTGDLRLLRAGITLRRRTGGHDAGWHLKLPAAPGSRQEIRLPAGQAGGPVPRELAELVFARTRGAELAPVAVITTRRQRVILLDASGQALAEVADDQVTAGTRPAAGPELTWREIEVELAGGDGPLLAAADKLLRKHGLRRSGRSAKLERVLERRLPAASRRPRLTPQTPAVQAIASYLAGQAEKLQALDPLVRASEPDAVHQMRVTTRRLRSTLRAFGAVLSRDGTAHVAAELKWLGDVLGAARDVEVLAAHLQRHLDQTDIAQLLGPLQARIQSYFARSRESAQAALTDALNSGRYAALLDELDAVISAPPPGPDATAAAGQALPAAVRRSYATTRRRLNRAWRMPAGTARDAALHQARKAAKRARYAAEAAAPALGPDASRFARRVKQVQAALGDHQDTVIARQLERRLGTAAHRAGESAFSYGLFYERDACDARRYSRRAAWAWRKASKPRARRWLRPGQG